MMFVSQIVILDRFLFNTLFYTLMYLVECLLVSWYCIVTELWILYSKVAYQFIKQIICEAKISVVADSKSTWKGMLKADITLSRSTFFQHKRFNK